MSNSLESLIKLLSRVPGVGLRSARRIVLFLLRQKQSVLKPLVENLQHVHDRVLKCECGNLTESAVCSICSSESRDRGVMCVVEDVTGLWAIEESGAFDGVYHVLDGILSPVDGISPEELNTEVLIARIKALSTKEVVLGLSATVEGQATAYYLTRLLTGVAKCSKLRLGLPMGGDISTSDACTIAAAIKDRVD